MRNSLGPSAALNPNLLALPHAREVAVAVAVAAQLTPVRVVNEANSLGEALLPPGQNPNDETENTETPANSPHNIYQSAVSGNLLFFTSLLMSITFAMKCIYTNADERDTKLIITDHSMLPDAATILSLISSNFISSCAQRVTPRNIAIIKFISLILALGFQLSQLSLFIADKTIQIAPLCDGDSLVVKILFGCVICIGQSANNAQGCQGEGGPVFTLPYLFSENTDLRCVPEVEFCNDKDKDPCLPLECSLTPGNSLQNPRLFCKGPEEGDQDGKYVILGSVMSLAFVQLPLDPCNAQESGTGINVNATSSTV